MAAASKEAPPAPCAAAPRDQSPPPPPHPSNKHDDWEVDGHEKLRPLVIYREIFGGKSPMDTVFHATAKLAQLWPSCCLWKGKKVIIIFEL